MCADERPLGIGLFDFLSGPEEDFRYRGVEAAEFAEVLEVVVHILISNDRQGQPLGEWLIFVFLQNCFCKAVEVYRKAVVGLLCGYI